VIAVGGEVIAAGIYVRFWWPAIPAVAAGGGVRGGRRSRVNAATGAAVRHRRVLVRDGQASWRSSCHLLGAVLIVFGLPAAARTGLHT